MNEHFVRRKHVKRTWVAEYNYNGRSVQYMLIRPPFVIMDHLKTH